MTFEFLTNNLYRGFINFSREAVCPCITLRIKLCSFADEGSRFYCCIILRIILCWNFFWRAWPPDPVYNRSLRLLWIPPAEMVLIPVLRSCIATPTITFWVQACICTIVLVHKKIPARCFWFRELWYLTILAY